MLWIEAFHVICVVAWFAGLFYLPRLYVYHAAATDTISIERFKIMERRLYWGIATPAAILTTLFGAILIYLHYQYYLHAAWMHLKLTLAVGLWIYHIYLAKLLKQFARDDNHHSERFYRILNEVPTLFLISMVILVVVKPV